MYLGCIQPIKYQSTMPWLYAHVDISSSCLSFHLPTLLGVDSHNAIVAFPYRCPKRVKGRPQISHLDKHEASLDSIPAAQIRVPERRYGSSRK